MNISTRLQIQPTVIRRICLRYPWAYLAANWLEYDNDHLEKSSTVWSERWPWPTFQLTCQNHPPTHLEQRERWHCSTRFCFVPWFLEIRLHWSTPCCSHRDEHQPHDNKDRHVADQGPDVHVEGANRWKHPLALVDTRSNYLRLDQEPADLDSSQVDVDQASSASNWTTPVHLEQCNDQLAITDSKF